MTVPILGHGALRRRAALPLLAVLLAALVALAAGCGGSSGSSGSSGGQRELTVFDGASPTDAFTRLGDQFTAAHPA